VETWWIAELLGNFLNIDPQLMILVIWLEHAWTSKKLFHKIFPWPLTFEQIRLTLYFSWKFPHTTNIKASYPRYKWRCQLANATLWKSSVCPFCNIFSIQMSKRQRPFSPRPVLSTCIGSSSDSVSSRHPLPARQYLPNVSMFLAAQSSLGGCLDPDVPVSLKKYCQTTIISVLCTILKEQTVLKIHVNSSLKCVSSLLIEKVMLSRTPLYPLIAEACLPPK